MRSNWNQALEVKHWERAIWGVGLREADIDPSLSCQYVQPLNAGHKLGEGAWGSAIERWRKSMLALLGSTLPKSCNHDQAWWRYILLMIWKTQQPWAKHSQPKVGAACITLIDWLCLETHSNNPHRYCGNC